MPTKVAFIGLGAMGLPMASNLQRKGFDVCVYDLVPDKAAPLMALGARAAGSIAEVVRGAEIVVTMLPATGDVEQVALGAGGALDAMAPNAILMNMSTIDGKGTDRIAAACAARGIQFADCPVGRPVSAAERGESLFMVGADDATFAKVEPLLKAMGSTIHRCGAPGMGSRMKVINNFILLSTAQIVAEAVALGTKLGLDIETMKAVTADTTARNGQFHLVFPGKVLAGDIEPGFTIDLAFKDLTLAMTAAADQRVGLPVGSAVHAVYGGARATGYAVKDYTAVVTLACDRAGIDVPRLKR